MPRVCSLEREVVEVALTLLPAYAAATGVQCVDSPRGQGASGHRTMAAMDDDSITPYAAMFDRLSEVYDQSGVPFFGVIARRPRGPARRAPRRDRARHRLGPGRGDTATCGGRRAYGPGGLPRPRARHGPSPRRGHRTSRAGARRPGRRRRPAAARRAVRPDRVVTGALLPPRAGRGAPAMARPAPAGGPPRHHHLPAVAGHLAGLDGPVRRVRAGVLLGRRPLLHGRQRRGDADRRPASRRCAPSSRRT